MNFFIILEMSGQTPEQPIVVGGDMDFELGAFGNFVKNNSVVSGRGAVGALAKANLSNPYELSFAAPMGKNEHKRDLLVKDALLNEKNFINYWKSREKHRDSSILPYPIRYGKIDDLDEDGFEEKVAYYNDGTQDYVIGYNQYVLGPPNSSQKKVKANYYQLPSKVRQQQSYADYMAANTDKLTGWMDEAAIQKYKESLEKKLITKVKKFFNEVDTYKTLTAAQKTKVANIFIQVVAEAMIDDAANRAKASVVKGMKGFIEAKNDFIVSLINNQAVKNNRTAIFNHIVSGNAAQVETKIEGLATASERRLSASDVDQLFEYATQNKYMRSLVRPREYTEKHKDGYDKWMNKLYGVSPLTSDLGEL